MPQEQQQIPAEFVLTELAQQRNAAQDEAAHLRAANRVLQMRVDALEQAAAEAKSNAKV